MSVVRTPPSAHLSFPGRTRSTPCPGRVLGARSYARIGTDYVEVTIDRAASTPEKTVWRVVTPDGVLPDIVPHRLRETASFKDAAFRADVVDPVWDMGALGPEVPAAGPALSNIGGCARRRERAAVAA